MTKLGDVFKFVSNKVIANSPKPKYHIAVKLSKDGYFLFISSNAFEGAMAIDRTDWPEMPKLESFVSFSKLVCYKKPDLKGVTIERCGALTDECIDKIRQHALDSLVMEQWEINMIVLAIDDLRKC